MTARLRKPRSKPGAVAAIALLVAPNTAWAVNANPVPGSLWTWLGATFGADWVAPQVVQGNTPKAWGGIGDGLANDTGPVLSCMTASVTGFPCTLTNGTIFVIDSIAIPSGTRIVGSGTLKRLPNSANSTFLRGSCVNLVMSGITIDGNKAVETNGADDLYCQNYQNVRLDGITVMSAKAGSGIVLDTSVDQSAATYSALNGLFIHDNDGHGLLGHTAAWQLQVNNVTSVHNGQYGAFFGPTGTANNVDSVLKYITVQGGNYSYNVQAGLAAQGYVSSYMGGNPNNPVFGPGIEPVFGAKFIGVTATYNSYYGIVMEARNSLLADSFAAYNAALGAQGAGVLGNGEGVDIVNVVSVFNNQPQGMGLDAGGGLGVHVIGGVYANNYIGINIGATNYSSVRGATVTDNTGPAIYALSSEASGSWGMPGYTTSLVITGNRISCGTGSSNFGIDIDSGGLGIQVSDNYIQGCASNYATVVEANSAKVQNNVVPKSGDISFLNPSGQDYDAPASVSGTLGLPVWADTVALTGTNNFNSIKSLEALAVGTGVYSVQFLNGGSGYTPSTVATWSGCTTPPTGTVMMTQTGVLTGYRFTTNGSGCVGPTVSFSIGTGQQNIVYQVPLSGSFQKDLLLFLSGSSTLTMGTGGNVSLASPITSAGASSTVRFHWGYNNGLFETSRVLH